jgi:putative membrane protein insertion efficiency factor
VWWSGWPARSVLLGVIRGYRHSLGLALGGRCRFHPSCSEYADRAIAELGALRGGLLAVWRVLRCSPLSSGGVDHPPRSRRSVYAPIIRPSEGTPV